ncbi:MAG TPA: 6-phosphogluconolactonase [Gemmatimonadota bacterium]|nr:6-phosphogluconolactonase [Gemmatimonadota bacterium]
MTVPVPGSVRVHAAGAWPGAAGLAVLAALREAAAAGPVSLALAGGSTPVPLYRWLAAREDVPWSRIDVFFGDERCVPPDDPDSNYRTARKTLLGPAEVEAARVHRMPAERDDREAAAADYAALLPPHLTVLLLGIGEEGHTASLFPGSPALEERERRVVPVTAPADPPERLTVTPPVLEQAARVFVLATGQRKAEPVARALEAPWAPDVCPAQLARRGTWLLDRAAAAHLSRDTVAAVSGEAPEAP